MGIARFLGLIGCVAGLAIAGCSGPSIRTESKPGVNVAAYKTFDWAPQKQLEQPMEFSARRDDILDHQIKAQVDDFLMHKGLVQDNANPDLKVAYSVRTRKQVQISPGFYPEPFYNYWDTQPSQRVVQNQQGSVTIDLIDAKTGKLVWRGIAVRDVGDTGVTHQDVHDSVAQILQKLPGATQTG